MKIEVGIAAGLLVVATAAGEAQAQTPAQRETARHLMDEGDRLFDEKKYAEALRSFESANEIMHVPTTGLEVARAYAALGRLVEGRDAALVVTRMPGAESENKTFADARREATQLADKLGKRIPSVQLEIPPEVDASLVKASIDYDELAAGLDPKNVNPGRHTVRARAEGFLTFVQEVDVKEGGTTVVHVVFAKDAPNVPVLGRVPPLAIAGLSVAATGLLIGTVTGIMSLDRAGDARKLCGPDTTRCDPAAIGDIDASRTLGWISTVSFGLAVVGGGIATYAFLSKKKTDEPKPRVDVVVLPAGAGMTGTF